MADKDKTLDHYTDEELLAECEDQSIVHWSVAEEIAKRYRKAKGLPKKGRG